MLRDRRILLAVTGSIAAYKAAFLTRELVKAGADVKVLLSEGAEAFISPLTFSTLSGKPVLRSMIPDPEKGIWEDHIHWGRWPELILVAPATADTIARSVQGRADDLFGLIHLSATCPVHFAPAMDLEMHRHPATQENMRVLQERGAHLIPAQEGELASGLEGEGRLEEPERIVEHLEAFFAKKERLKGKKVLISAGPTREAIDPVRFIGNRSSGKMGVAIAEAAAERGAEVTLVLGPSSVRPRHPSVRVVDVESTKEMYNACTEAFPEQDFAVMAAAVADHRPKSAASEKIKKQGKESLDLELESTEDILAALGKMKKEQLLVGFALETDSGEEEAERKRKEKGADLIVLNSMSTEGAGFQHDTNEVTLIDGRNDPERIPLDLKSRIAERILDRVESLLER